MGVPAEPGRGDLGIADAVFSQLLRAGPNEVEIAPDQVEDAAAEFRELMTGFSRFRLYYQFGIEEISTKINILRQEFENTHSYSPIEHVRTRLKSPESLLTKVVRTGCELSIPAIRERVRDIAGIRITCSFVSDVYWIASMLIKQPDVTLVQTKDYIAHPKPNGYRSLHLIVQVPVFLSDHTELVYVEIQIRTIAMDFWASVEHKLFYKYREELPPSLMAELDEAARIADQLDHRMGRLRDKIQTLDDRTSPD
ncbi:MAG: GTP pyrophosphokinase family protein [Propionicimonas sp.]|uniref:GTP pyrophosphokinase n=1 Tax=Propionicimonas sp. TaxID=1955623 RepID=UPI002B20E7E8|nr:GTP pyrophosphokinase family protein [Propionicimonas sp.]MEA4944970.1 GTP pyrophosphokinase family protein [Propionicimonas sp.]MEA5052198.1 GTP pyrophosphokinase family protein [Propionicimonas sp.]MEA5117460.1 GTP pyrophosphokinase family protein [Propionicimonas sp.]